MGESFRKYRLNKIWTRTNVHGDFTPPHSTCNAVTRGIIMYDPTPYNTTWLHVTHSYTEETLPNPVLYNTIMSNLAQCKTILFNPAPFNTNPFTLHHATQFRLPCTMQHNPVYPPSYNTVPSTLHHETPSRLPCTMQHNLVYHALCNIILSTCTMQHNPVYPAPCNTITSTLKQHNPVYPASYNTFPSTMHYTT